MFVETIARGYGSLIVARGFWYKGIRVYYRLA